MTYRTDLDGAVTFYLDGKTVILVFLWRKSTDIDFRGLVGAWRPAIFFDHTPRLGGILFPHQNNGAADSGENILLGVEGRDIGIDPGGLQQAVHDQGFGFLFGVENPHQLFIGIRAQRDVGS